MEAIIIIFAIIFGFWIFSKIRREQRINQRVANFSVPNFFTPHESYVSAHLNSAIAVDKENYLIGLQDGNRQSNYYDARHIVTSQLILNEQTHQKHPFLNTWGWYLVGKWIFNDKVGEIAALTSKVRIEKKINSIKIRVTVNDLSKPNYTIVFLEGSASKRQQLQALQQAEYWDSIIKIFVHNDNRTRLAMDA